MNKEKKGDPNASNRIIMDYSIHDAIEAGFNHVVFIIRKDIEKEFKEVIGDRIASICSAHVLTSHYVTKENTKSKEDEKLSKGYQADDRKSEQWTGKSQ